MILHIPHSSFFIPPEIRASITLREEDLKPELIRMTDLFTDELFDPDESHRKVVYPVSRIVCDPERFLDDEAEQILVHYSPAHAKNRMMFKCSTSL